MSGAPRIGAILETVLYVADLDRGMAFFRDVMGLPVLSDQERLKAFDVGGQGVLLLFEAGATTETVRFPGGTIPPHDGQGPVHMAFAIAAEALEPWRQHLEANGVEIEGEAAWPRGGHSLYFRDPDGHCLELATPGLWPGY
ncbi:VOC family protein [Poseidonocella sp. HB161398]|uniref:VOC family protein n=1 Tax=Poseidonocella sp. HB161398 TaxID=2320855 RepID=UPI0011095BA8|nr:VOC family protein [Poseidonocella sp. HB161398]